MNQDFLPFMVVETAVFARQADSLLTLSELETLRRNIALDPEQGKLVKGGNGLRKARVSLGSRGKRGGARIIYWIYVEERTIYMLALYAKNEQSDLTQAQIRILAKMIADGGLYEKR